MKRSSLKRGSGLRTRTGLSAKCVCGHARSYHAGGRGKCQAECSLNVEPCMGYLPKRSLAQGTPLKPRKALPEKRRFAKLRAPDYLIWIRQQPCCVSGAVSGQEIAREGNCWGIAKFCMGDRLCRVEAAHVKSRGAGGADIANSVPLDAGLHLESHTIGQRSFEKKYGVDLKGIAERLYEQYQAGSVSRGAPRTNFHSRS